MDHHVPKGQCKHHMRHMRLLSDKIGVLGDFQTSKCRLQILGFPESVGRDHLCEAEFKKSQELSHQINS